MKAVILAGGLGTRLHPLTVDLPKPMVPLANRPLMSYLIELLAAHGFKDIYALLYHQPEVIKDHFGDGKKYGVRIKYFEAGEDYGTAGAVRFACRDLREPLLVISADLVTDIDLAAAVKFHRQKKAAATVVLTRVENPLPYGIVITERNGRIKRFLEKPSWGEVFSDTVNAGIYLLQPEALKFIPPHRPFDFSRDLFPALLKDKKPLYGHIAEGYWRDIGKLEDYAGCHYDLLTGRVKARLAGKRRPDEAIWFGKGAVVAPTVKLKGACLVGEGSRVAEQAELDNTILGRNCRVDNGAVLRECIVWDNVLIGADARLERTIIANDAAVGDRTNLAEGVVVGAETRIGPRASVRPFIKIWPRKTVEAGAAVSRSMIWRERWSRSIFGSFGVTGQFNTEITPQFAAALGAAYGSILGQDAMVAGSRDSHKSSRAVYRALISGILSTGVNVANLEMVPIPVNRYGVRSLKVQGGFHVRKSPFDHEVIDLKFFDAEGMDLAPGQEKKIERIFFSEDFHRTRVDQAGELSYPFHRVAEEYCSGLIDFLKERGAHQAGKKMVIDYSFGATSQIFPFILGECGLNAIALNADIDPNRITKDRAAFERSLQELSGLVVKVGADLGVMLDTGGEKLFLCDERGRVLSGDELLAVMALMAFLSRKKAAVAVPVKESRVIEQLAKKYRGRVIRTRNSYRGMMEAACRPGVTLVGESQGGYIFPKFLPAFDGLLSACLIVDFLEKRQLKLSELIAEIPRINLVSREVGCSAEDKGKVMRRMLDSHDGNGRVETEDGLKFWHERDWALVLPDAARPVIHLYAEAATRRRAEFLLEKYQREIDTIRRQ